MSFKVGDKVRWTGETYVYRGDGTGLTKYQVYTVSGFHHNNTCVRLEGFDLPGHFWMTMHFEAAE